MKRVRLRDRILPDYTKGEEIFNMVSHIVGGALGIAYLTLCVITAALHHNPLGVVASAIYGFSVITLFSISSIYHGMKPSMAKKVLQVLDHCTIYLMIAGSYTPFALCSVRSQNTAAGWTLFGLIWAVTAVGIVFTAIDVHKYRVFSMICYIGMGWCVVGFWKYTYAAIGNGGTIFLVVGGVLYTIGAVLYGMGKRKRYIHSIFHIFVNLASLCHFFCILFYVL